MSCIDCFNFKMKKGWKFAYCSQNSLTTNDGKKDRLFKVDGTSGKNILQRAPGMAVLNQECGSFDDMRG